jgi:hypothetical protein
MRSLADREPTLFPSPCCAPQLGTLCVISTAEGSNMRMGGRLGAQNRQFGRLKHMAVWPQRLSTAAKGIAPLQLCDAVQ